VEVVNVSETTDANLHVMIIFFLEITKGSFNSVRRLSVSMENQA